MKTLFELLEEFHEYLIGLKTEPYSAGNYKSQCRNFVKYMSERGAISADKITRELLYQWHKSQLNHITIKGQPLKASSINKRIRCIKAYLRFLAKRGYILKALPEELEYIKEPKLLPLGIFTHEEITAVLEKMDINTPLGYRDRAILEFLYSTGCRAGEVVGLKVRNVNLEEQTALVMGKGKKERIVPFGKTAKKFLETYIRAVRPYLLNGRQSDKVFISRLGQGISYRSILRLVHQYCDESGIETNVTPHTFRRSCTTELVKGGEANLYHVKELLGHEQLETLRPYVKLTITDLKKTHAKCHPREREE